MTAKKNQLIILLFALAIMTLPVFAWADSVGAQMSFYVDSGYDAQNRGQLSATLKVKGDQVYFYVEDEYWSSLNSTQKQDTRDELEFLAEEFDTVIYPRMRSVFGGEWSPGIDNDERITVLFSRLDSTAGGYFRTADEYSRSQVSESNEREMVYLNANNILDHRNKSFLAHEFQHLISFNQKTRLREAQEDVWLNEARSEYAPTACGYSEDYQNSYFGSRMDLFLGDPSNSLTEWKNNISDYGVATAFIHYLVSHYGEEIIIRMMLNEKTGIASIEQALRDLGYREDFGSVFSDWVVTNYINDCQVNPEEKYCYLNDNLKYLDVDYTASYSGFPHLTISRVGTTKDWTGQWYRFRQHSASASDTFKLVFDGSGKYGEFDVPYIIKENGESIVRFMKLDGQKGEFHVPNFGSKSREIIISPFNQNKESGFGSDENNISFEFTASSVSYQTPFITDVQVSNGEVVIEGENFSDVVEIYLDNDEITDFNVEGDGKITFNSSAENLNDVDLKLTNSDGHMDVFVGAFAASTGSGSPTQYPEGSLLRAEGDYKVYVIKDGYKRWIQTAEIFNYYGHLKWRDIIEVDENILSEYQEVSFIRAADDGKVYYVDGEGVKHWLDITAQEFVDSGYSWNMVFVVNQWERDYYNTGAEIRK